MKNRLIFIFILAAALSSFGQANANKFKTEILEYVSAVYDPISEETQVAFKTEDNQQRIFYYTKNDELKHEEQFFNLPVLPITEAGKDLTKTELLGKRYQVAYFALTEYSTLNCCFKMQSCQSAD